ncbi:hypothetical protein TM48_00942 [Mycobacterium shottsii]|uniref:Uncharacterized protein n=1 Tax=Mycobacterium shottsii TaxID=133549 RepID=A0A7I7L8J1_9MYCO|nr:hypothetical protein TM48_00942 [Mycobacterium shottsii]BBX56396.1 hypothetical protein MSHO_17410 [Mycobacterium shottsii]
MTDRLTDDLTDDQPSSDRLARWSSLASAIAGRLRVSAAASGALAWTNGRAIFVDTELPERNQLESLVVQAAMLAAGSLEPGVLRVLGRRPALAKRYLAIDANRALAANEGWLPPSMRNLIDGDIAARSESPSDALAVARGHDPIADPPYPKPKSMTRRDFTNVTVNRDRIRLASGPPG